MPSRIMSPKMLNFLAPVHYSGKVSGRAGAGNDKSFMKDFLTMTNDFDRKAIAKSLRAMRAKHGADSDIGHRCSNLIEQLKHYPTLPAENRLIMRKSIAKSVEELAKLSQP